MQEKLPSIMYNWRVAAVKNALIQAGKPPGTPLQLTDLTSLGHLDQYHYRELEACDDCIDRLQILPEARILDVGSGIGGPARYIAAQADCTVIGVDIQKDLVDAATDLTRRVVNRLSDKVKFVCADITELNDTDYGGLLPKESFDHAISFLTILHIPDRRKVLKVIYDRLKPGSTIYIEDFICEEKFTKKEEHELKNIVGAHNVPSLDTYREDLYATGFDGLMIRSFSYIWKLWTRERYEMFLNQSKEFAQDHGEDVCKDRLCFYKTVSDLFNGGRLGGVCIMAYKPPLAPDSHAMRLKGKLHPR